MVKRTEPIRVISLVLLTACGALCQNRSSADRLQGVQFDGSNAPEVQRQKMHAAGSLPDAPSTVQPPAQAQGFFTFVNAARSPSTPGAPGVGVMRETKPGQFTTGPQRKLTPQYQVAFIQRASNAFLGKYVYPPLLKRNTRYYASTSDSFIGRASYAASRIFVRRDDSGKGRLNTSYFLAVLTSVAVHTAYRPSWKRSTSETFNDLGSKIGRGAGINVFDEFRPGILHIVKGLTPKFVSKIENRITNNEIPKR